MKKKLAHTQGVKHLDKLNLIWQFGLILVCFHPVYQQCIVVHFTTCMITLLLWFSLHL